MLRPDGERGVRGEAHDRVGGRALRATAALPEVPAEVPFPSPRIPDWAGMELELREAGSGLPRLKLRV